jgi:hypothetical protein
MPEHAAENTEFTLAEKSMHVLLAVQDHACLSSNQKGIVHYELIAQEQMVNQQRYLRVLSRLWESLLRKRPNCGLKSGLSTMTMPLHMMH